MRLASYFFLFYSVIPWPNTLHLTSYLKRPRPPPVPAIPILGVSHIQRSGLSLITKLQQRMTARVGGGGTLTLFFAAVVVAAAVLVAFLVFVAVARLVVVGAPVVGALGPRCG